MARLKAIIFDLDDTLYDCTGSLVENARRRAAKAMVAHGLPETEVRAYEMQAELTRRIGPRCKVFDRIAEQYGLSEDFVEAALDAYNSGEVEDIHPFPEVIPTLQALHGQGYLIFLVTVGVHRRQEEKIDRLGIRDLFTEIVINDRELGVAREESYIDLMTRYGLTPHECVAVGDRIHSEIRVANYLKMTTVQMIHGKFKSLMPKNDLEEPDYKITRIDQVLEVLSAAGKRRRTSARVVAVGGGTGLPILLEGLKAHTTSLTAVVTVTDSGRSSGKLRRSLGVLPPGDARNCLIALSSDRHAEKYLYDLFQYRFDEGDLAGMSFGNLFLAALEKITGSFELALRTASEILAVEGRVLPSTLTDTHICARLADGSVVREEFNVRGLGKSRIDEVFLEPEHVEAAEEAVGSIRHADLVIIGPGSLYTSVVTNLLVPGISQAIRQSNARVAYICNIVTQPGQTDGFNASDHVRAVQRYLGEGVLDYVIVNDKVPPPEIMAAYEQEGSQVVGVDEGVASLGPNVVRADILEPISERRILWEKQDLLRHDPQKLADLVMDLR